MAKASHASAPAAKVLTRAKSERTIASLDRVKDRAALEEFAKNGNKHIATKAAFKLAEPADRKGMTAEKNAKKTSA